MPHNDRRSRDRTIEEELIRGEAALRIKQIEAEAHSK